MESKITYGEMQKSKSLHFKFILHHFLLRSFIIFFSFLLLWQCIVTLFQLPHYILPTPLQVFTTLYQQKNLLLVHTYPTLLETLLGFILGICCGCLAGLTLVFFRPLALWFLPILIMSQAIPTFAIAPLLVIWLGFGLASKIVVTILMIFFPVTSSFYDGLKNTNQNWLDLATTMNAAKWRTFVYIRIPAALPPTASGIRIAACIAPIGAIVGEWVGSSEGLGYLMLNANARLQIDLMFAALFIIIAIALLLYFLIDKLLRKFIWWQA